MYTHASLVEFIDQWAPTTPFPIRIVRVIYEFTEYIKKRVKVDIEELVELLTKRGYIADIETMTIIS